jgi:IclR family KDG regulon transcriptional repressor
MGVSDIAGKLGLNKSTVFNIGHTLDDLNVLENQGEGKYVLGTRFYVLSNMVGRRSPLIKTAHPYLERINEKTKHSAFGIKLSSEIGTKMPVLAGAGIKAMLSQLSDEEIDEILARTELKQYTPNSIIDKTVFKNELNNIRKQGVAYDREEYIEGMVAFGVPIRANGKGVQAAIWAVGLTSQVSNISISEITEMLQRIREELDYRLQ